MQCRIRAVKMARGEPEQARMALSMRALARGACVVEAEVVE